MVIPGSTKCVESIVMSKHLWNVWTPKCVGTMGEIGEAVGIAVVRELDQGMRDILWSMRGSEADMRRS